MRTCVLTNREAFRGAFVLMDQGAISRGGANGPYADSTRQVGFVDFGASHLMKTFASLELAQKSSWYQKWNVHLFARPEVSFDDNRQVFFFVHPKIMTLRTFLILFTAYSKRSTYFGVMCS